MYQVLARQWRPKNFHELVGQTHVAEALAYALDHHRIHHAHLFTGTRGVGKTTIARIFAKSLNCLTNGVSSNPCGTCEHCTEIDAGRFPDLIEVDAASRTGVDDTRELLDNVPYAPVKGRYKVYLIDEVHMFSKSSFNALLKTLEEPPLHVKFILATTDPQKMPPTVLSRCLQFHLKNLTPRQIAAHLANILQHENTPFDDEALTMLARAGNGSMRDALSLLDQAIAFGQGEVRTAKVAGLLGAVPAHHFIALMEAMAHQDCAGLRKILAEVDEYAPDYTALLAELMGQFQRVTVLQLKAQQPDEYFEPELASLAGRLPVELMQLWYQIATDSWQYFPYQPNTKLAFEMMLLRMAALQPLFPNVPVKAVPDLSTRDDETVQMAARLGQIAHHHEAEKSKGIAEQSVVAEQAVAEAAVAESSGSEPIAEQPVAEAALVENAESETIAEQPVPEAPVSESSAPETIAEQAVAEAPVVESLAPETIAEQVLAEAPIIQEAVAENPVQTTEAVPQPQSTPEVPPLNEAPPVENAGADSSVEWLPWDDDVPPLTTDIPPATDDEALLWMSDSPAVVPQAEIAPEIAPQADIVPKPAEIAPQAESDPKPVEVASQADIAPTPAEVTPQAETASQPTETAPQTTADAQPADLPPLPPLAATVGDVEKWAIYVQHLPKEGKLRMFADNSCPLDWQPPRLTLQVPFMMTGYDDGKRLPALAAAISALTGEPCEIVLNIYDEVMTPGKWRHLAKEAEQLRAEQAFHDHALTRALQERLDAKVQMQSIQSMKTQTE